MNTFQYIRELMIEDNVERQVIDDVLHIGAQHDSMFDLLVLYTVDRNNKAELLEDIHDELSFHYNAGNI